MVRKSTRPPAPRAERRATDQALSSRAFDRPAEGWNDRLALMFSRLGVDLPGERTLGALGIYLDEVIRWGRKVDLVAPRTLDELFELSFADAIVLFQGEKTHASPRRFVDVGSGGGAPGIPLALLLSESSDCVFTFVEPRDKRVAFLHHLVGTLGLANAQVVRGRSESVAPGYDVAVSRATLPPIPWLAEGARLAEVVWVLLAREEVPEDSRLFLDAVVDYHWPFQEIPHRAARFVRKS